jgi:hypothetical protein
MEEGLVASPPYRIVRLRDAADRLVRRPWITRSHPVDNRRSAATRDAERRGDIGSKLQCPTWSKAVADLKDLLGTWTMLSWRKETIATGETVDALGPDPVGYVTYGADGRMNAIVVRRDRPAPETLPPTDTEKLRLFDSMLAYSGTYTLDDEKVMAEIGGHCVRNNCYQCHLVLSRRNHRSSAKRQGGVSPTAHCGTDVGKIQRNQRAVDQHAQ